MPEQSLQIAFLDVLQSLEDWLASEDVPHVTIGGIAVSLLAEPRATQDIDLVVWLDHEKWEGFIESGKTFGFSPRLSDALEFAERTRVFLLRHNTSQINIDISCGALPFEKEMIEGAQSVKVGELSIKVPTPEDLIITKGVANRAKDIFDIEAIIRLYPNLNESRIKKWMQEFAEVLDMPELLASIEKLLQKRLPSKKAVKSDSRKPKRK